MNNFLCSYALVAAATDYGRDRQKRHLEMAMGEALVTSSRNEQHTRRLGKTWNPNPIENKKAPRPVRKG